MGYQITFLPSEEKMKEYKPWSEDSVRYLEESLSSAKREVVSMCLKKDENQSFYSLEKKISTIINSIGKTVKELERFYAYNRWSADEEKSIWYCGWEFARESDMDGDFLIESTIDKLLILADVVETPDYFSDSEKFYEKWNEIKEELDGFIESMQDIAIHDIIDDLDEFKEKDEDDEENNILETEMEENKEID